MLGIGTTGVVVLQKGAALKIPVRWSTSSPEEVEANIEALQHEQEIYSRLEGCDGVVQVLNGSETTLRLRLMKNGDIRSYLSQNRPSRHRQLLWFREMARALAQIHDRRVIVADIASRNFFLDSDLSVKFCDFSESHILLLEACVETADEGGYTVKTDIGLLGAVIYEIIAEQRCEFDIFKDISIEATGGTWPRREDLPSTKNLWLGHIIEKCWTKDAFCSAYDLLNELESIDLDHRLFGRRKICQGSGLRAGPNSIFRMKGILFSPIALASFGAIVLCLWSQGRGVGLRMSLGNLSTKISVAQILGIVSQC